MIFIAGGTGRLGTVVVELLTERNLDVRVLTRDHDRAKHLPPNAQIVVGDVGHAASVEVSVNGARVVRDRSHIRDRLI